MSDSVVDLLSQRIEFSKFLRLIQRNGLIPWLNQNGNFSLLAPINSAFAEHFDDNSLKSFKNYIVTEEFKSHQIDRTYIYNALDNSPILVSPKKGNADKQLKVEIDNATLIIEPDIISKHQNAVVHGISALLPSFSNISTVLLHPTVLKLELTRFSRLLMIEPDIWPSVTNVTLLIPSNSAFESAFNGVERLYLRSPYAREERRWLLKAHILKGIHGGYQEAVSIIPTLESSVSISFTSSDLGDNAIVLDNPKSYTSTTTNIIASDGLAHIFQDILLSPDKIEAKFDFNPSKYLLALDCSDFVQEVKFRSMFELIKNKTIHQTIFAPQNNPDLFKALSQSSLQYHFVPYQVNLESLMNDTNTLLVESEMITKKIGMHPQMLKFHKTMDGTISINGDNRIVSDEIYKIGQTWIYLINGSLEPPHSLQTAVGPLVNCAKTLTFLGKTNLLSLESGIGWTVIVPNENAWNELGLVTRFLKLKQNKNLLKNVLTSLIIKEPVYTETDGIVETETLEGTKINITMAENKLVLSQATENGRTHELDIKHSDILFDKGVAHVVNKVPITESVQISPYQLIDSTNSEEFLKLLQRSSISHVLDPTENYSILVPTSHSMKLANISSTNDSINFWGDQFIDEFLRLHILPNNTAFGLVSSNDSNDPNDFVSIPTLLDNINLTSTYAGEASHLIKLVQDSNSEAEVRVLSKGKATTVNSNQILLIDKPISPLWIDKNPHHYLPPYPHLGTPIAIGIGVIVGIVALSLGLCCLLVLILGRKDKHGEREPLLENGADEEPVENSVYYASTGTTNDVNNSQVFGSNLNGGSDSGPEFSETSYSDNAVSKPIDTSRTNLAKANGVLNGLPTIRE